ncbi:MAG: cation:proton antiporter [Thermoleophilia bacterium]
MVEDGQPGMPQRRWPIRTWTVYGVMIAVAVIVFVLVRGYGESLVAPAPSTAAVPGAAEGTNAFLRVLVALTAIIVLGRILARLLARLSQPPVIGEVIAGILLGPSLLGTHLSGFILPVTVVPYLEVIAQLGVVLYMFLVGLELNPALLRRHAEALVFTSHASILVPFLLGMLLALPLYTRLAHSGASFTSFALFMGVAMSITAFPVLARILGDYRMAKTKIGVMALGCAAVNDVTAWCLLALAAGVANAQASKGLIVVVGAVAFIAFMFLVGRPLLRRVTRRLGEREQSRTLCAVIFVALLLSAITAEAIGIHAIFGAFLLGAIIPHDSAVARTLTHQLEDFVIILLLPAFFALTGMRTRIDLLSEPVLWLLFILILVVAVVGKFGGTFAAARLTGLSGGGSAMLGTLMNTRGLMELIVLNVGLELGVISLKLYSLLVLMTVATTLLTSPLLRWLRGRIMRKGDPDGLFVEAGG